MVETERSEAVHQDGARMAYAQADIAGDVVLVTGATSGIGEACAWRFAEAGCKLVLTGRRGQRLDSLKASIEAKHEGVTVTCVTMDVTDLERVAALPGALLPLEVDILVNNSTVRVCRQCLPRVVFVLLSLLVYLFFILLKCLV